MVLTYGVAEQAIQSFEVLTQLRVCVHDLSGCLRASVDPVRAWHGGALCRQVKSGPYASRCESFEITELRPDLIELAESGGRVHQCHAGLTEWVFPLVEKGKPHAVLFAGQRRAVDWSPELVQAASPLALPKAAPVAEYMATHYLEALRQLGERLLSIIRTGPQLELNQYGEETRRHKILYYIDRHHQKPLRISDLAKVLHLSPSRVAHVVREETGSTWSALLKQARLKTACALLRKSDKDLAQIAYLSGFSDQSQFHKVFRRHFSVSPGQYRKDPEFH